MCSNSQWRLGWQLYSQLYQVGGAMGGPVQMSLSDCIWNDLPCEPGMEGGWHCGFCEVANLRRQKWKEDMFGTFASLCPGVLVSHSTFIKELLLFSDSLQLEGSGVTLPSKNSWEIWTLSQGDYPFGVKDSFEVRNYLEILSLPFCFRL